MRYVQLWETDLPGSEEARKRRSIGRGHILSLGSEADTSIAAYETCAVCGVEKMIVHMSPVRFEGHVLMECSKCNPNARKAFLRHMQTLDRQSQRDQNRLGVTCKWPALPVTKGKYAGKPGDYL
jgi:hypothetical protein